MICLQKNSLLICLIFQEISVYFLYIKIILNCKLKSLTFERQSQRTPQNFFKVFKVFVQKVLKNGPIFLGKSTGNGSGFKFLRYSGKHFGQFDLLGQFFKKNRKRKWIFSKTFEFMRCLSKKFWKMGRFFLKSPQETEVASIF